MATSWGPISEEWGIYPPYVPVATRKKRAAEALRALEKKGQRVAPVRIQGRLIARTFWGKGWCDNLERYSDYANRLPRGRSYVRNGSVIDLQIAAGKVTALVQGSSLYEVSIDIGPVEPARWKEIVQECSGKIDSVVELLSGKLSGAVMEVITRKGAGLFPAPAQIKVRCSCPDYADMCKHVAATLYGTGARLDHRPELLFELRGADPAELAARAAAGGVLRGRDARQKGNVLAGADLSAMFGIDIDDAPAAPKPTRAKSSASPDRPPAAPAKPAPASKTAPARPAKTAPASKSPRAKPAPAKTAHASEPAPAKAAHTAAKPPSPVVAKTRRPPVRAQEATVRRRAAVEPRAPRASDGSVAALVAALQKAAPRADPDTVASIVALAQRPSTRAT